MRRKIDQQAKAHPTCSRVCYAEFLRVFGLAAGSGGNQSRFAMKAYHFVLLALVLVGCSTRTHSLNADQARTRARGVANEQARKLYGAQPFWNGAPARFVQGQWVWSDRRGCGVGDLEATVTLAADGSPRSVDVILLNSQRGDF